MTQTEQLRWNKIQSFTFDEPGTSFSFSKRVARENGWAMAYTERVIEEYKRFIFLCCISDKGITPSDPVDQVWHLHLTYTKSYWVDFCRNTLEKEIHHNPTKGGQAEAEKFDVYYTRLQELYTDKFITAPPKDIWHNNQQRFSDINFRRINLGANWVVKKPARRLRLQLSVLFMLLLGLVSVKAVAGGIIIGIIGVVVIFIGLSIFFEKKNNNKNENNNDSSGGCGGSSGCGSDGHSGGDSGCSGSGCSGCGGGGD